MKTCSFVITVMLSFTPFVCSWVVAVFTNEISIVHTTMNGHRSGYQNNYYYCMLLQTSLRLHYTAIFLLHTTSATSTSTTASSTTATTPPTNSYAPAMLHYSVRVVFRPLVNQVLVKTEVFANQDIQTKGIVVCVVGASPPLTAKKV